MKALVHFECGSALLLKYEIPCGKSGVIDKNYDSEYNKIGKK